MNWDEIGADAQDLVWSFCGDLRDARQRHHKFVGIELKCWNLLAAPVRLRPSYLVRQYRHVGINHLKDTLELAYLNAQREAFAEGAAPV